MTADVERATFRYRWQTLKGAVVVAVVIGWFLFAPWPCEVVALTAAGVLLVSRDMASREMPGLVDYLLVLFIGFVVNAAFAQSGLLGDALSGLRASGLDLGTRRLAHVCAPIP